MTLVAERLGKAFTNQDGHVEVFSDFSFTWDSGSIIGLLGPNGCGKTTLLRLIAGLETADSGSTRWNGTPDPRIGFVHQTYVDGTLPWLPVRSNLEFASSLKTSDSHLDSEVITIAEELGLKSFLDRRASTLSGGYQQLLSIGIPLIGSPDILLLDEPFSQLDYYRKLSVQVGIRARRVAKGFLTVLVCHDIDDILLVADRLVVLSERPARIRGVLELEDERVRDQDYLSSAEATRVRSEALAMFFSGGEK